MDRSERRVQVRLERVAADLAACESSARALYEERGRLYVAGVALGITQVTLAEWSGASPDAVAKVLRKLREPAA